MLRAKTRRGCLRYSIGQLQGQKTLKAVIVFGKRQQYYRGVLNSLPITVDTETMSGARVFEGTRVPMSALLDNFEAGVSLDQFPDNFSTVTREQAVQVLVHFRAGGPYITENCLGTVVSIEDA